MLIYCLKLQSNNWYTSTTIVALATRQGYRRNIADFPEQENRLLEIGASSCSCWRTSCAARCHACSHRCRIGARLAPVAGGIARCSDRDGMRSGPKQLCFGPFLHVYDSPGCPELLRRPFMNNRDKASRKRTAAKSTTPFA